MEKTTERQKFGIRDIMTIAAMMVITFLVAMIIGSFTLPFPAVYLYGSAGIDAFIGAIFYLVAANRVNKHGLLFAWAAVYGLIQGVMGYMFLIPYFLVVDGQCHRQLCWLCRTAVVGLGQLSGNGCEQWF